MAASRCSKRRRRTNFVRRNGYVSNTGPFVPEATTWMTHAVARPRVGGRGSKFDLYPSARMRAAQPALLRGGPGRRRISSLVPRAARDIGAAVGGGLHEGREVWTFDLARSALARQDADVVAAPKAYRSEHVVTLGEVDDVHQRPRGTARVTFNRNRSRSEEARHFFLRPLGAGRR